MSGDLISKSALIDALKVHFDSCFREDGELLYSDHICTSDDVVDLIKLVENQPTAYSVDKVINEMNQRKIKLLSYAQDYEIAMDFEQAEIYSQIAIEYTTAIEIVKQGSDANVVCEWKKIDEEGYKNCECNYDETIPDFFKYCPYCGKKIKKIKVIQNDN